MKRLVRGFSVLLFPLLFSATSIPGKPTLDPVTTTNLAPMIQQPAMEADGAFRFRVFGQVGANLTIQSSTDLSNWINLKNIVITNVPMEISDTDAKNFSARFYRLIPIDSSDSSSNRARMDRATDQTTKTAQTARPNKPEALFSAALVSKPPIGTQQSSDAKFTQPPLYPAIKAQSANIEYVSAERSKRKLMLTTKLNRVVVSRFSASGAALGDLLIRLSQESRRLDPDGRGVNFIIDRSTARDPRTSSQTSIDPANGLPVSGDPADVEITVDPLTNTTLASVLGEIVKGSSVPIQYSILDYAVAFSLSQREPSHF